MWSLRSRHPSHLAWFIRSRKVAFGYMADFRPSGDQSSQSVVQIWGAPHDPLRERHQLAIAEFDVAVQDARVFRQPDFLATPKHG
jgi:hypothetical protein